MDSEPRESVVRKKGSAHETHSTGYVRGTRELTKDPPRGQSWDIKIHKVGLDRNLESKVNGHDLSGSVAL